MEWLRDPTAHFPPQRDGDLVEDGVCSVFIADKLGVSQPTASVHLKLLTGTGLLRAKKVKQWTFYRRDEQRIAEVKRMFDEGW
ncbi:helix-turn-helix transcriptional regulator [Streptomyces sp. WAC 06738]|uniref:helix-turn-helix transcriptional regulator n=1 Tax=Streptomyces sp. WAC 06738 TaxID=2203210 RepID=UPI001F0C7F9A